MRLLLPLSFALTLVGPVRCQLPSDDMATGVWPWLVGNIDADVPSIVAQASQVGLDTLYVHIFRTTGPGQGTLHVAAEAPGWNTSWGPVSPDLNLSNFIAQAHAAGIQVVGVVNCFLSGGPLPGDAAHEALLLQVVDYLVNSFGPDGAPVWELDGIALDRVRFYTGTTNPHQAVNDFVDLVRTRVGVLPLHAFLPANLYFIDGPTYDGNFRTYAQAMSLLTGQFGHRWEDLATRLDVMIPMAYVATGGLYGNGTPLMQAYVQTAAQFAGTAVALAGATGVRILPAVRTWNDATGTTTGASVNACVTGALLGGADGAMSFRYYTSLGQTSWWNAITVHAHPGPDLPLAALSVASVVGQTVVLDASGSSSATQSSASLDVRFDFDDDGVADTAWSNQQVRSFLLPDTSPRRVAVEVRDAAGRRAARKIRVAPAASLVPSTFLVNGGSGGSVGFTLDVGAAAAGHGYVLLGSTSGSLPGVALSPDILLPLNVDPFTYLLLQFAGSSFLPGFVGSLDAGGGATASLVIPAGLPSIVPTLMTFAAVGIEPVVGAPSFATNSTFLFLIP